jgi:hypothetical protein
MPLELGVWRIDGKLKRVAPAKLDQESRLEDFIHDDISLVRDDLWIIGRQVPTAHGHFIDLLAMDASGNLTVLELKRDRTPRDVVAQALDYGSWVRTLTRTDVGGIYGEYVRKFHAGKAIQAFEAAFEERFGGQLPETINEAHELLIVAAELDNSTERIIEYVSAFGVPVNALFFRVYRDGDREYLARAWLRDPGEAQVRTEEAQAQQKGKEPWNGHDFYFAYGGRNWDDAREFGFVSAGGGRWYTNSLRQLAPGHRLFVHVPGNGYVGVARVVAPAVSAHEFEVTTPDGTKQTLAASKLKNREILLGQGTDKAEMVVGVEWLKTVPLEEAFWDNGLFANQNSACRLRSRFTIERLTQHFGIAE